MDMISISFKNSSAMASSSFFSSISFTAMKRPVFRIIPMKTLPKDPLPICPPRTKFRIAEAGTLSNVWKFTPLTGFRFSSSTCGTSTYNLCDPTMRYRPGPSVMMGPGASVGPSSASISATSAQIHGCNFTHVNGIFHQGEHVHRAFVRHGLNLWNIIRVAVAQVHAPSMVCCAG